MGCLYDSFQDSARFSRADGHSRKVAGTASPGADVSSGKSPPRLLWDPNSTQSVFRDPGSRKEFSDEMVRGNPRALPGPTRADYPCPLKAKVPFASPVSFLGVGATLFPGLRTLLW